jgi:hypothetical protein
MMARNKRKRKTFFPIDKVPFYCKSLLGTSLQLSNKP